MCLRALAVGLSRMHPICVYASHNTLTLKKKKRERGFVALEILGMWVAGKNKKGEGGVPGVKPSFFLPPALPPVAQLDHHVASTWCFALCFRPWTHTSDNSLHLYQLSLDSSLYPKYIAFS